MVIPQFLINFLIMLQPTVEFCLALPSTPLHAYMNRLTLSKYSLPSSSNAGNNAIINPRMAGRSLPLRGK